MEASKKPHKRISRDALILTEIFVEFLVAIKYNIIWRRKMPIKNFDELEFSVFCIENLAQKLNRDSTEVFDSLKRSDMLNGYIVPCYDSLHTQGKDYILNDILEATKTKGIVL